MRYSVRGYRRGTSLLWVRRSTAGAAESASGAQQPQQQHAEWECAELALRAHRAFTTVLAPLLSTALARAAEEGRIGRLCSEHAACRGMHVGRIERGDAAAGLLRYSQRGPSHAM